MEDTEPRVGSAQTMEWLITKKEWYAR